MASFSHFFLFLTLISSSLSLSHSLTCSSQSFPANRSFTNCQDLPYLNAFLHWTYDPQNSSLSIAFLAPLPRPLGWVAWAVNPTATGMIGSEAFLATLSDGGHIASITTFNVTSYSSVLPSLSLSFPFWDVAAESTNGHLCIFVTVKVPAKAKSLNQVWQVGPSVDSGSGIPTAHEFKADNLNARSVLVFDESGGGVTPIPAPRAHGGASSAPVPTVGGDDKAGVAGIRWRNLGLVVSWFVFVVCGIFGF
ncbi:auxin-induced in root cultures protein 12-like [Benincasa hispida]|uniref:auxin-induced in root cultures protein 12-like n=1 Tax=Benincasa hispida TaxID=102211 RepID=UPI0018FF1965|nr:auxin-induced in root cultures protein 12-like [Benincasa hispida]